jgi:hypothetical protein
LISQISIGEIQQILRAVDFGYGGFREEAAVLEMTILLLF